MPIQIHGKDYVTCAERLKLVQESGKSFEVVESAPLPVGDRWLWRCAIKVDGCLFVANAEVKLSNARRGSPDESNPMECGETSALARCLGFAGFGVIDSVASADEILRGQASQTVEKSQPHPSPSTLSQPTSRPSGSVVEASIAQTSNMSRLIEKAKERTTKIGYGWNVVKQNNGLENVADADLVIQQIGKINAWLTAKEREPKGAA